MTRSFQWLHESTVTQGNASVTLTEAITAGDVYVAIDAGAYASTASHGTSISGLGATWTKLGAATNAISEVWIGVGGSDLASGQTVTLTGPALPSNERRRLIVYCFRGVGSTASVTQATAASSATTPTQDAGSDAVVVAFGYSDVQINALNGLTPATDWATITPFLVYTASRYVATSHRIPASTETHSASATRSGGGTVFVTLLVLSGTIADPPTQGFWGLPIA